MPLSSLQPTILLMKLLYTVEKGHFLKFLADECCDAGLVSAMREEGHDVLYVLEEDRGGTDDSVLTRACSEGRILITEDKDFGELVYRLKKPAVGIVLIRISVEKRNSKWPQIEKLLKEFGDRVKGHFVVVGEDSFRFRKLCSDTPVLLVRNALPKESER